MTAVSRLLHRAARHGLTIYWDDKRGSAVIWPVKGADRNLIRALHLRGEEIVDLLGAAGSGSVPVNSAAGRCIKICITDCVTPLKKPPFYGHFEGSQRCR